MAKKVLLKDHADNYILPITRGEFILDSSGKQAFKSEQFLASTSQPGLMSSEDKKKIDNVQTDDSLSTTSANPVQNKVVTSAINKAQADATDAKTTANANKEELTKTQQILNAIKTSYLKSVSVSGNTLTIKDQNDSEVEFYNTTYEIVSSSSNGLAPAIGTSVSSIIGNQADEWVLTSTKGEAPTWRKLPANAFLNNNDNTTYTLEGRLEDNTFISTLKPSSGTNTSSTVPAMVAASASEAGKAGLVPAPAKGDQNKFLSGAGTWNTLPSLYVTNEETGNAITDVEVSGHGITLKRGTTFSVNGHTHSSDDITALPSYVKATAASAIASTDSLNAALGKLELKTDTAYTLVAGAYDGDGTIENLAEILKVLEGISDTDTIQAIIGKYLPLSGGTLTGLLTTTAGSSHAGIKVGDTYINAINGDLIFQNNSAIRFGGDSWDYNVWAGLKYVHSSKTIYLGLADNNAFTANSAQSGGIVTFPGVSALSLTSDSRIHAGGGNLYLGNSNNAGWLMLQDVCSQSGNTYWHIYNGGAARFGQITSTVADGTAPFVTSSTTKVSNWNADMVDGFHIYERNLGVNGTNWTFASMYSTATTTIYAPTTAGTSGYLLKSNGSGAPTWTNTIGSSTTSLNTSYITNMYADALYLKSYYPSSGDIYISGFTSAPDSSSRVRLYTARYAIIKNNSSSTACAIYAPGGFYESSDEKLKTILNPIKVDLEDLTKLRKVYFLWKNQSDKKLQIGTIAQDVQKLFPELVSTDDSDYLSVAYDKLSIVALAAIDELYNMVKNLQNENEELKRKLIR